VQKLVDAAAFMRHRSSRAATPPIEARTGGFHILLYEVCCSGCARAVLVSVIIIASDPLLGRDLAHTTITLPTALVAVIAVSYAASAVIVDYASARCFVACGLHSG
jgi:hypothetical protein